MDWGWVILAAVLFAPLASAQDGAPPLECALGAPCEPLVVCVSGPTCEVNACGPVLCDVTVTYAYECNQNVDIEGETCQRSVSSHGIVSAAQVRLAEVNGGVALTDGGVRMLNLRNTWFSHSAQGSASVAGIDSGTVSATLYRSDIDTSNDNHATQVGVAAAHSQGDLPGTEMDVLAGVVFIDNQPRSCFVRMSPGASVECPQGILLFMP